MYSPDSPEANKDNPFSPTPDLPLREQFLYRFSALEEAVRSGFRRLDERMDRMQTDLHDGQINANDRINHMEKEFTETIAFKRQRIDGLEKRVRDLEEWSKIFMARAAIVGGVLLLFWTFIAPIARTALGISNG